MIYEAGIGGEHFQIERGAGPRVLELNDTVTRELEQGQKQGARRFRGKLFRKSDAVEPEPKL